MIATRFAPVVLLLVAPTVLAFGKRDSDRLVDIDCLNRQLHGQVHDYTANHHGDRRIQSSALGCPRDLYIYVPPGYDKAKRYPVIIWLHGLAQDETSFLSIIPVLDREMAAGRLPKSVVAAPDGTVRGKASLREPPAFYLNSPLGRYEDFVVVDVWNHIVSNYSIRPERQAHVLAGASMGAFGSYNLGIKHKADYGVVVGVLPPLNLRYSDCNGRTDTDFDPNTYRWAEVYRPNAVVARFGPCGIVSIKQKQIIEPVFGSGPDVVAKVAAENPADMLFSRDVKPGDLEMFAGYGQFDEFNADAQTESFAAAARGRGITVHTVMVPGGKHDKATALAMVPNFVEWLHPKLAPYAPKD